MSTRILIAAIILAIGIVAPVAADTVTHLGNAIDFGDGWRSTNEFKATPANSDPDGDNAWGTDGYYVARGATLASSLPGYITSVTDNRQGLAVDSVLFDDPALPIAPDVSPDLGGAFWQNGPITFTVTLAQDATFVITVIFDIATSVYDVNAITVAGPTASDDTTTGTTNDNVDYAFFEVSGNAGQSFTVTCNHAVANVALAGLGFEAVPAAASTPGTLIYGK